MTKYILEIDSDENDAAQLIEDFIVDNKYALYDFAKGYCLWEDDGSTFVSKSGLIYEG